MAERLHIGLEAVRWAVARCRTPGEQLILFVLATYCDTCGVTTVGQRTIARVACCSVHTVATNLRRLEQAGLIARVHRSKWSDEHQRPVREASYVVLAPLAADRDEMTDAGPRWPDEVRELARTATPQPESPTGGIPQSGNATQGQSVPSQGDSGPSQGDSGPEYLAEDLPEHLVQLAARGVTNPAEFANLPVQFVLDWVTWYDAQAGRVRAGLLVIKLREGRPAPPTHPAARRESTVTDCTIDEAALPAWRDIAASADLEPLAVALHGSHPHRTVDPTKLIIGVPPMSAAFLRRALRSRADHIATQLGRRTLQLVECSHIEGDEVQHADGQVAGLNGAAR